MGEFNENILKNLYTPAPDSHKGQNGRLMIIGGSHLFHAASLWALEVASRIVDMVFYSSVSENNAIVSKEKEAFRNGIVLPREKLDSYINEADCVLIGPGLPREEGKEAGDDDTKALTEHLLIKYPQKRWVIDGGSLQVIAPNMLPKHALITPHHGEFVKLFGKEATKENVGAMAKQYDITILAKGQTDIVCLPTSCVSIAGGNVGMTKGGTGDVLAGLVAALACKNDPFLAAQAGSFINKKAGDELYKRVGPYFNASDLADEISRTMVSFLGHRR